MRNVRARGLLLVCAACLLNVTAAAAQVKLDEQRPDPKKARAEAVACAKAELSRALEVEPASIAVVSATAMKWPDASLGCPQPDRMYAQVVTRGWTVILKVDGKTHEMHVSGGRAKHCGIARR